MTILSRNLQALRQNDPELAERVDRGAGGDPSVRPCTATSGATTVSVDGRLEASGHDPEDEARILASHFLQEAESAGAERMVMFGVGVHTLRFMDRYSGDLLVVEPSLAVCRAVLEHVDLSEVILRVELIVGEDPTRALSSRCFQDESRGVFVSHAAARRRAPALHDALVRRFHAGGVASPLDIAIIPPLYGGSLPVAHSCARALRELGHRVRDIDLEAFHSSYLEIQRITADPRLAPARSVLSAGLCRLISETLHASFHLDRPDLVFAFAQAPLDVDAIDAFRKLGIRCAFWFCEDFRVMDYWKGICSSYDVFFHLQPDDFSGPLRDAGAYGVPLRLGFDASIFKPPSMATRQEYDLSFVGAAYHNRVAFLPGLLELGLKIFGVHWPQQAPFAEAMPRGNEWLSSRESARIFHSTRVNLNLHSSPWVDGVNPAGDYVNPRTFELAGSRAFQLVDERRDLHRFFAIGSEIETFSDLPDCRRKVRHYLDHPDERVEMAERAQARAVAEHTYRHRMSEAMQAIERGPFPLLPQKQTFPTAGSVASAADDEPGLREILQRLDPEREIDGRSISEAVGLGSGPLTTDEKILLFMRETLAEITSANAAGDVA